MRLARIPIVSAPDRYRSQNESRCKYSQQLRLIRTKSPNLLRLLTFHQDVIPRALIPTWTSRPIPGISLSAGGLLALADLHTVAQRTAIKGGSSWLDSLVLAPGLHYQQAAESLGAEGVFLPAAGGPSPAANRMVGTRAAQESDSGLDDGRMRAMEPGGGNGRETSHLVNNTAMASFIGNLCRDKDVGSLLTLNVGMKPKKGEKRRQPGKLLKEVEEDIDWLSHLLYLGTPILTAIAIVFMILLEDCKTTSPFFSVLTSDTGWGLGSICALMASRVINIWVIKQRSKPPRPLAPANRSDKLTEYFISIPPKDVTICLRGLSTDLQALTSQRWLRSKSHIEEHLEACAKLLVYLVAATSGNTTQAGELVLMGLLLASAALLGLSNSHAKGFEMHGRLAQPERKRDDRDDEGFRGEQYGARRHDRDMGRPAQRGHAEELAREDDRPGYPPSPPYPQSSDLTSPPESSFMATQSSHFTDLEESAGMGQMRGSRQPVTAFDRGLRPEFPSHGRRSWN